MPAERPATLDVVPALEVVRSAVDATDPAVSVVVSTYNRAGFLPDLFAALEAQQIDGATYEILVCDNGSTDDTWPVLCRLARESRVATTVMRLAPTGGPSLPRNTAAVHARAPRIALTDDDCVPDPGWLRGHLAAGAAGAVVQGRTTPLGAPEGTWQRSITIEAATGLYETCNLSLPRDEFLAVGGFGRAEFAHRLARPFGEDVVLGAAAARRCGLTFASDALVRHRWMPGTYRGFLDERRRLRMFPMLLQEVPELRDRFFGGVFLSRRTAAFDAAVAGVVAAALSRRALPLAAAVPWIRLAVPEARWRVGRPVAWRLAQAAVADGTGLVSLVEGSVRFRRLLL